MHDIKLLTVCVIFAILQINQLGEKYRNIERLGKGDRFLYLDLMAVKVRKMNLHAW